jgi:general stress protein 26
VRTIFTYTVIDIDDEFIESLTEIDTFIENAFGNSDNKVSAYYKYNSKVKAHINVVSFSQVLEDANKRNRVFLDILKQNFSLGDNNE